MKKIWRMIVLAIALFCLVGCGATDPAAETSAGTCFPQENAVLYTVFCCVGESNAGVEGVIINFCTEDACYPIVSDETGKAVFTGSPAKYHVQIIRVPEGWQLEGDAEWYTEPCAQTFQVQFS